MAWRNKPMSYTVDMKKIEQEFIQEGFFSEYLPRNFNLSPSKKNIFDIPISEKKDYIEPYCYTMSRFSENGKRRNIYIPELTSYILTVSYMKGHNLVKDLINISQKTDKSYSPIIQASGELTRHEQVYAFDITSVIGEEEKSTYIPNIVRKIIRSKGAKGILCLDISSFYASIYTHFIPIIKLGYNEAQRQYIAFKANQKDTSISLDYVIYKDLDIIIRNMNCGRSNGILPGTLVSQFIAEAFLSTIDVEIEKRNINFVRYVDDYEIFIYDEQDIERIQNEISLIMERYSLVFNNEKTKYMEFPYYATKNLEKIYQKYVGKKIPSSDFMELFNEFFLLEKTVKGATRFLIKSIDNRLDFEHKIPLYESYLFDVLVNDSRSLVKVCELIIKQKEKLKIKRSELKVVINLFEKHIKSKNHLESIWLLYLLKNIGINSLPDQMYKLVIDSDNDLLKIMLIEEYKILNDETLKNTCIDNAKSWILLYHLFLRNYITKDEFVTKSKIVHNKSFYASLKRSGFQFYKPIK